MTTLQIADGHLRIRFTRTEKALGLFRDADVPLSTVTTVDVVADGIGAVTGLRVPGTALPGRWVGTWRRRGHKTLVNVRRGKPTLRILLDGYRYDELLLRYDDAERLADDIRAQVRG